VSHRLASVPKYETSHISQFTNNAVLGQSQVSSKVSPVSQHHSIPHKGT
jgi:hypothetical protein